MSCDVGSSLFCKLNVATWESNLTVYDDSPFVKGTETYSDIEDGLYGQMRLKKRYETLVFDILPFVERKQVEFDQNGRKGETMNGFHNPLRLAYLCASLLSSESGNRVLKYLATQARNDSLCKKILQYFDIKPKTKVGNGYLEPSSKLRTTSVNDIFKKGFISCNDIEPKVKDGDKCFEPSSSGISNLQTRDVIRKRNTMNLSKAVVKSAVNKPTGDLVLDFAPRTRDKIMREFVFGTYLANIIWYTAVFNCKPKDYISSEINLSELEMNFFCSPTKPTTWEIAKYGYEQNDPHYKARLQNRDEIEILMQALDSDAGLFENGNGRSLLENINSWLCLPNGAKIPNDKRIQRKIGKIVSKLIGSFSTANDSICQKGMITENFTPETNNASVGTSKSDENVTNYETVYLPAESNRNEKPDIITVHQEKITKLKDSLCDGHSRFWSDYCHRLGHGVMCPYEERCMFFESKLCEFCNSCYLPRNSERYEHNAECLRKWYEVNSLVQHNAECLRKWYEENSLVLLNSKNGHDKTLCKRYYNVVTGYTQIFCNSCGQVCKESDLDSNDERTIKQTTHECKTYSDLPIITSSPWMTENESLTTPLQLEPGKCDTCIWAPKGEFGAFHNFYPCHLQVKCTV